KIDLNMDKLDELQKQLAAVLDKDQADFIIAYREGGPYTGNGSAQAISSQTLDLTQKGNVKLNSILDLIGVKTQIAKGGSSAGNQNGNSGKHPTPGGPSLPVSPPSAGSGGGGGGRGGGGGG